MLRRCSLTMGAGGVVYSQPIGDCSRACRQSGELFLISVLLAVAWLLLHGTVRGVSVDAAADLSRVESQQAPGVIESPARRKAEPAFPKVLEDSLSSKAASVPVEEEEPTGTLFGEYRMLEKAEKHIDEIVNRGALTGGIIRSLLAGLCFYLAGLFPLNPYVSRGLTRWGTVGAGLAGVSFSQYLWSVWKRAKQRHRIGEARRNVALHRATRSERKKDRQRLLKSVRRDAVPPLEGVTALAFTGWLIHQLLSSSYGLIALPVATVIPRQIETIVSSWKKRRKAQKALEQDDEA